MAQIRADEITTLLRQEIENYEGAIDVNRLAADGRRCTQLQATVAFICVNLRVSAAKIEV